jgi:hypothetical protein
LPEKLTRKRIRNSTPNPATLRGGIFFNHLTGETTMTNFQQQLIEKLTTAQQWKVTTAKFNGPFLNCVANLQSGKKVKRQKFSFVFDSPEDVQGCRQVGRMSGAYAEHYAKAAFELIVKYSNQIAQMPV